MAGQRARAYVRRSRSGLGNGRKQNKTAKRMSGEHKAGSLPAAPLWVIDDLVGSAPAAPPAASPGSRGPNPQRPARRRSSIQNEAFIQSQLPERLRPRQLR